MPDAVGAPRPATGVPRVEIEELLQAVRRALAARDEDPTGAWVEESALELARGAKSGWVLDGPGGSGIAFAARRGPAVYGHVHAEGGLAPARRLATALLESLPADVRSLDLGFTGLGIGDERTITGELATSPGSTVIERQAMERALRSTDAHHASEPPPGLERVPVRAVTTEALAALDRAAFAGSVDALLVGDDPDASHRTIDALLAGRLGRFLDEASCALLEPSPTRLVGAVMTGERSPRRGIVLALMVEPARRGRGLGRFLFGWTLRALWALGYQNVRLWVSLANLPAMRLYERFELRAGLPATIYRWDRPATSAHPQASR